MTTAKLFLIPNISIFDVHDVAVRDWLNKLDDPALNSHLESPFKLDRFFPERTKHVLKGIDSVHSEILHLLDVIDPQVVFLDIPVDFVELENRYNKREISPSAFWSEYYQISGTEGASQALYCIYIEGIIDRNIRLIENREHLPYSVIFYGTDIKTRQELIPVYDNILEKDDEFLLKIARVVNEITSLRESPKHLWYSQMQVRRAAVSYEETEQFYTELLIRLRRFLKFKIRHYVVKSLRDNALEFKSAYEKFLDYKMREDEIKLSNIIDGLNILKAQSEQEAVVIFCAPMHYSFLMDSLENEKGTGLGITVEDINITTLLDRMKPFLQKNRIMQSNYETALDILGLKKHEKFKSKGSVLIPG